MALTKATQNVIAPITSTGSTTARTLANRFADVVNVKDFGAVGDGVTDDSAAFLAAHTATPNGKPIYVPPGNYKISTIFDCFGRHWTFEGSTFSPLGNLNGGIIQYIDTTVISYGTGNQNQYGGYYKFGRNSGVPKGFQIGGAEPIDGPNGNLFFTDGYAGTTAIQPTIFPSTAELALQPCAVAGQCNLSVGGNTVTRTSGAEFFQKLVGKRIYLGDGTYLCSSVVNASTLTVINLNGSAVSFASSGPVTYVFAPILGEGICNTSGTTITRISGDPFTVPGNTEYKIKINGIVYDVTSAGANSLTISTSAGTQTNVAYEFWTSVDDIMSAFRVHRISGAGFEENITIGAYGPGYFHIQSAGGVGRQYPLYIGTGYHLNDNNSKRKQISLEANGNLNLGGSSGKSTIFIESADGNSTNGFVFGPALTGGSPAFKVDGIDSNISLNLTTKGFGSFFFHSHNFTERNFEIAATTGTSSYLGVSASAFNEPTIYSSGSAENINIRLLPKGTGRVLIGPWTTNADVAVNGYIEVRDSSGNLRKIATIA